MEDVVGNGLRRDDIDPAGVDRGSEEHVELGAMVERQGVQRDVVAGNARVDHAADILPEDRVMRQLHPLRPRLGAARIDDLRHVE